MKLGGPKVSKNLAGPKVPKPRSNPSKPVSKIQDRKKFDDSQYGGDWENLKRRCKERDGWKCRKCGYKPPKHLRFHLHADHIISITKGGRNTLSNLQTLCKFCHALKHPHLNNRTDRKIRRRAWLSKGKKKNQKAVARRGRN